MKFLLFLTFFNIFYCQMTININDASYECTLKDG